MAWCPGPVTAAVVALHHSPRHTFSKSSVGAAELVAGIGIRGDAHAGALVRHRSRVAADPNQPNLRQVHLIAAELFDVLATVGHEVAPGDLGENVTTAGLDVEALAVGTVLALGDDALVAVTGLRNPCRQIERFQPRLLRRRRVRDRRRLRAPRRGDGHRRTRRERPRRRRDRHHPATGPAVAARAGVTGGRDGQSCSAALRAAPASSTAGRAAGTNPPIPKNPWIRPS